MWNNISEDSIKRAVLRARSCSVKLNEPMKHHTTMQVGGPCALFFSPESEKEIISIRKVLTEEEIPFYVIGNGSNLICRDEGYNGAIICLKDRFKGYRITAKDSDTVLVAVKAGTLNKDFSDAMAAKGFSGFEFASGIPGTVGGACSMNAGAYDGEIKNIVSKVKILDQDGNIRELSNDEMNFGYRSSAALTNGYIVLEVVFLLKKSSEEAVRGKIDELTKKREEKQPLEYPSCGSTFKRPQGYFAGKLISDAGLKGCSVGGAQVSEKHAGFIINRDNASAEDVLKLIEHVKDEVYKSQGVKLECEVKIL